MQDSLVHAADVLLDRYVIERELAHGGMATVYLARDARHDTRVAVKVLHPELGPVAGEARFSREIQITARLQHPNILPIFDSGRVDGVPFYVMPYVEGESLAQRVAREGELPVNEAVEIAAEIADALAHAHAAGLVHRDVKPGNILLTHGHAMITDFGIAHVAEATQSNRLTETGFTLGTAAYMSPEQGSGSEIDARSDIYSLGCVLYEMLCGHPPFTGPNSQAVIARHLVETAPSIGPVRQTVTPTLEAIVQRTLAKTPADRFADAGQLRDALRHLDAPLPPLRAAPAPGKRMRAWMGGSAIGVAIVAIALIAWLASRRMLAPGGAAGVGPDRIAVLYFDDESPRHDMAYLADGLTERLIQTLSAVPAIHVVSRNGVAPFRGRAAPLDVLKRTLHVGSVVEGSVQRAGDRVRVNVQLVDATTGDQLASHTIEHPATDIFALEDDVTEQVADLLRTRLGQSIRLREIQEGTSSQTARELVLRGEEARNDASAITHGRRAGNAQDASALLLQSDSLLARASAADARWVEPVVDRGWVMMDLASLRSGAERAPLLQRALSLADAALARAPGDAGALELHGTALWRLIDASPTGGADTARLRRAEHDLRAAVAADSMLASAWSTLSQILRLNGSLAEASIAAQRALSADAYLENAPEVMDQLYRTKLLLGDVRGAARTCADGRRRFPGDARFVECRLTQMLVDTAAAPTPRAAWSLVASLDSADLDARDTAPAVQYASIYHHMAAAAIAARAGDRDTALATIAWARHRVRSDRSASIDLNYDEAYVRLALGDRDRALALLREYLAARPTYRAYIARDPLFTRLRGDARFRSLLAAGPA